MTVWLYVAVLPRRARYQIRVREEGQCESPPLPSAPFRSPPLPSPPLPSPPLPPSGSSSSGRGLPALVLLDMKVGQVVNPDACAELEEDPGGVLFPWPQVSAVSFDPGWCFCLGSMSGQVLCKNMMDDYTDDRMDDHMDNHMGLGSRMPTWHKAGGPSCLASRGGRAPLLVCVVCGCMPAYMVS